MRRIASQKARRKRTRLSDERQKCIMCLGCKFIARDVAFRDKPRDARTEKINKIESVIISRILKRLFLIL